MPSPTFIEEHSLCLVDVCRILETFEKRDTEMNFLSKKAKEYVDIFVIMPVKKKEELQKKLQSLNLTRLREEHIAKIVDFLPKTANELKIVLQAYPLSLPKNDQESIVNTVKSVAEA